MTDFGTELPASATVAGGAPAIGNPSPAPATAPDPKQPAAPAPAPDPKQPAAPEAAPYGKRIFAAAKAGDQAEVKKLFIDRVSDLANQHGVQPYKIIFLFDDLDSITDYHSDRIYSDLSRDNDPRNILLLVHSSGGKIEPAYLISKTCKKLAREKFVVAVPRRAKSAATLLALGADEIHLGMMSQLGPIDPQVNELPALGLANGLTKVSQLVSEFPNSAEMWAKFLSENLSLRHLGYMERLSESAAQYAERLLQNKKLPEDKSAKSLAEHFVNHYKDHSFLIDVDEAEGLLGSEIVRTATAEYSFANQVYGDFDWIAFLLKVFHTKEIYFVGELSANSISIRDIKSN